MDKKAVITILGLAGGKVEKLDNGELKLTNFKDKQKYFFEDSQSGAQEYTNTLPLLIDKYKEPDYKIIPIFTKEAKLLQEKLLVENEDKKDLAIFDDNYLIKDDNNFEDILKIINSALSIKEYDKFIIDLTHGFRHLPILATISLIMQNIKNNDKIEHIWFAQEKIKPEPAKGEKAKVQGEYKIIDLIEYLDLANLSFMLSTFNDNYTVSNNIKFKNELYTKISEELSQFSHHFLSNSLKPLIEGDLVINIIEQLNELKKEESINNFGDYIDEISNHLQEIQKLKNKAYEFEKLYELSQIMSKRGYLLNAITMLFEAIGFYCLERFEDNLDAVKKRKKVYENFINQKHKPHHIYSWYTMVNQSRTIVKVTSRFNISDDSLFIDSQMKNAINEYVKSIEDIENFKKYIEDMEALRNNLAHGNTSDSLEDVKNTYDGMLGQFRKFCMEDNILQKNGDSKKDDVSPNNQQSSKPNPATLMKKYGSITITPKSQMI